MPNGLIQDDSLRVHPEGLALSLTIPWYRSLWLSSVGTLKVTVDSEAVDAADLAFELAGTRFALDDLPDQSDVLWYLQEHPLLIVKRGTPIALGESHEIEIFGELRLPYMQIAPGQDGGPGMYVPNIVRQTLTLTATDRDAAPPALVSDVPPPFRSPTDSDPFKLGLTLYSASAEFRAGWYDFDGLLDRVAELGIGPGIEIVASQVVPTYPVVSDEFVRTWRAAFDKHGFDESSFGANLDMGRRRDRDMTPDEEFEFSELMFQGAKKLGFPLVRIQSAKPELLRRLLPVAEKLDLTLAYEIHAPMGPNTEAILKVRDTYAELDSPLLGFVADFSSTMHCDVADAPAGRAARRPRRRGTRAPAADLGDGCLDAGAAAGVHRLPQEPRLRPGTAGLVRPSRVQYARPHRPARVGRHHAADQARAREVLRHRRERAGAGDRLSRTRARVRRGRLPRLLVERMGGSRVRRDRRGRPAGARAQAARPHPQVDARAAAGMTHTATDAAFDIRTLPFPEALRWLRQNGEPAEPRPDVDTASLRRRFPRLAGVTVTEVVVESPHGPQPGRVYRDKTATPSGRALVWVHGGAFLGGYLDMPESNWVALELASRGIPVFTVDYTKCLGDVHYPVPSDDVIAAWQQARVHAVELLGVEPDALVLGGASAGGTLTAGAVARLRDAGEAVPAGLVSVYPAAHPDGGHPGEIPDPASPMTQIALNYAGSAENLANPHVFAGLGSGDGYPPTLVVVCELDGLRPSGEAFAALLADAGVDVAVHLEPGADHAHINEPADPTALPTIEAIADWIRA